MRKLERRRFSASYRLLFLSIEDARGKEVLCKIQIVLSYHFGKRGENGGAIFKIIADEPMDVVIDQVTSLPGCTPCG